MRVPEVIPDVLLDGGGKNPTEEHYFAVLRVCDGWETGEIIEWLESRGFKMHFSTVYRCLRKARKKLGVAKAPRPSKAEKTKQRASAPKETSDVVIAKAVLAQASKDLLPVVDEAKIETNPELYASLLKQLGKTAKSLLAAVDNHPAGFALQGRETAEVVKACLLVTQEVRGKQDAEPVAPPQSAGNGQTVVPMETELAKRLRLARAAASKGNGGAPSA